jgi:hypothetical protein
MKSREWTVQIVAGTGERGFAGDGGAAARAQLNEPYGVVANSEHHQIRRLARD